MAKIKYHDRYHLYERQRHRDRYAEQQGVKRDPERAYTFWVRDSEVSDFTDIIGDREQHINNRQWRKLVGLAILERARANLKNKK